jgi:hypothetical protein
MISMIVSARTHAFVITCNSPGVGDGGGGGGGGGGDDGDGVGAVDGCGEGW